MSKQKKVETEVTATEQPSPSNTIVVNDVKSFTDKLQKMTDGLGKSVESNSVRIKKAKIKDDLFLEVEYTEELPGHSKKDTKLSCTVPVHDDLKTAFAALTGHLAILCDDISHKGKSVSEIDPDKIFGYNVRGFSIGGNGESEGCSINGSKEAKHGLVNLNSPFQQWEKSDYKLIHDLAGDIQRCEYEVKEYLFNGKRAPERQLGLFDDQEEAPADEMAQPEFE